MSWMSNGKKLSATWKEFMTPLNVRDEGPDVPVGACPHGNIESANKDKLMPFLVKKKLPNGSQSWVLNPFLDVIHQIFRNTLFPPVGDKDKVHAYLVDMMLLCEEARQHAAQPLDISHIMWNELRFAVYNRKVPTYGPYLQHLISKTWDKMVPEEDFSAPN